MQNPWDLDGDEIPDDAGIGQSSRGTTLLGTVLWASLLALLGLLVTTDAATQSLGDLLRAAATVVVAVALTVTLGWLAYFVIRRLGLVGGALFGVGFLVFLLIALPFIWQLLTERTDLLSGLFETVSLREPVSDLLSRETGPGTAPDATG